MEWEEARAEFFQETYPSDRSICDSIGGFTTTSSSRRTVVESGTADSRRSRSNAPLVASFSKKDGGGIYSSYGSRRSSQHGVASASSGIIGPGGPSRLTRLPTAASTTTVEVASSTTPEEVEEDDADEIPIIAPNSSQSKISTTSLVTQPRRSSRGTRLRMKAAVQGLDDNDSDGDIEIVDFADENLQTEVEVWSDMNKLKHLPIPLSQKKTMRLQYQKRPKIKLKRSIAFRFALKKFFYRLGSVGSLISNAFHKMTQPILVIDKHRGSEMFAALSLHRLAIILAFLISLNILLLLILPYAFYICADGDGRGDFCTTWNNFGHNVAVGDNVTNIIHVDATNYVEAFFQNLQLHTTSGHVDAINHNYNNVNNNNDPPTPRVFTAMSSRSDFAMSSHYQLPFFYGFFRVFAPPSADASGRQNNNNNNNNMHASKTLYTSERLEASSQSYDYPYVEEDVSEDRNRQTEVTDGSVTSSSIFRDIYWHHLPLIYVCLVVVSVSGLAIYFFRQFIGLVKGIIYDQTTDTWFKNVFSSWSFCVVCKTSSFLKHQSIYKHVKQKIRMSKSVRETFSLKCLVGTARTICACLTIGQWILNAFAIYFLCTLKPQQVRKFMLDYEINLSEDIQEELIRLMIFLPALLITLVKLLTPTIAGFFERWEHYPFTTKVTIYTGRLFFARAFAILAFITTLYHNASRTSASTPSSTTPCWEDHFCLQLMLVAVFDFVADVVLIFFIRLPRVAMRSAFRHAWNCTTKLTFDPYETMIDVVADLTLMSTGILYCPLIVVVVLIKLCLTYPVKLFHVWLNCSASRDIHSASCIRFLFVGFSSLMVVFSVVSLIFSLIFLPASVECGPFSRQKHIVEIISKELDGLPSISDISASTTTTSFLVGFILFLTFGLYISHLKRLSIEKNASDLKCQLAIVTQEKCYLLSKMKRVGGKSSKNSSTKNSRSNLLEN